MSGPYIMRKGVSEVGDLSDGHQAKGHGLYLPSYPAPPAKVFYVNYGGNDSESGLDPEAPLLTLTQAISLCTDDKHDTIVVMNWWQNESGPVTVNKRHLSIVAAKSGANWFGGSADFPAIQLEATGDTAFFQIAERDIAISGFRILGGASYGGIEFTGGAGYVRIGIFNNEFWSGKYGIHGAAGSTYQPSHRLTIKGNIFHSGCTTQGILLGSNGSWVNIENNFFETCPGPQIEISGGMAAGRILNNLHSLDSDTAGEAITLGAACSRMVVMGNRANDAGITAMTANPFVDGGTDNHWMDNYRCNAVLLPGG